MPRKSWKNMWSVLADTSNVMCVYLYGYLSRVRQRCYTDYRHVDMQQRVVGSERRMCNDDKQVPDIDIRQRDVGLEPMHT